MASWSKPPARPRAGLVFWLWGSLTLMQSLFDAGLIDEVRLLVCPATCGADRRFFENRRDLSLLEATGSTTVLSCSTAR